MKAVFSDEGWEDYVEWSSSDLKHMRRLDTLIESCRRTPFAGIGKPEPLKGDLKGWWSRRINDEHRIIYRVSGIGLTQALEIAQCRSHY